MMTNAKISKRILPILPSAQRVFAPLASIAQNTCLSTLLLVFALLMSVQSIHALEYQSTHTEGYYKTKMLCGSTEMNRYAELGKIWAASYMSAGIIPIIQDARSKGEFSQLDAGSELNALINDPQHFQAVNECFGNDRTQKNLFYIGLFAADFSGKFSAWALDASMLRIIYYGFRGAIAAGEAAIPMRLMWFRTFLLLASKNRTLLTKIADPAIMATFFSSAYIQGVVEERVQHNIVMNDLEANDPTLRSLLRDLKEMENVLQHSTDPYERQVLFFLIDGQKGSIEKIQAQYRNSKLKI